jgi:hypothetical protein
VHTYRRAVIIAAPLLLIVFSLTHGLDWFVMHGTHEDEEAFLAYIVQIRSRWLAVHVAGLGLFPLLGLMEWWMLSDAGWVAWIRRAALAVYMVLYTAFDAIAGIGSAVAAEYRQGVPTDQHAAVDGLMSSLLGDAPPIYYLAETANNAWTLGTLATAVALWQKYGWRVALPLAFGGLTMADSHFPPQGAVAGAFLSIAAWQFIRSSPRP